MLSSFLSVLAPDCNLSNQTWAALGAFPAHCVQPGAVSSHKKACTIDTCGSTAAAFQWWVKGSLHIVGVSVWLAFSGAVGCKV